MSREKDVYFAKLAEQAERYDEMSSFMEKVGKSGEELSVEDRNLLSVAFKNVVGARRASLRSLIGEISSNLNDLYKSQLQAELKQVCNKILNLLNDKLIARGEETEAQVFYLKMGADYYRYLAECLPDEEEYPKQAENFYKDAFDIAKTELPPTHPIRLGLALNYSVCMYEIVKKRDEACELAKDAFDRAIAELDKLEEADYKDSTLIMQLLRDNLTLWTHPGEDEDEN